MVLVIKTEPVQHTVKWEIKRRKREERIRKEFERREDRGMKTGLQGQGHAERIICTSNSVSHMEAATQMCAEGQKEEGTEKHAQSGWSSVACGMLIMILKYFHI